MDGNVYKIIELTGASTVSLEDAIKTAIHRASKTVRHMCWFQVTETRGAIKDQDVAEWQVTVKIGFKMES